MATAHARFNAAEGVEDALRAVEMLDGSIKQALGANGVQLLNEMSRQMPGTVFHSMRVLEMMRAAGYAILSDEAAAVLVHDCGKLIAPGLYAENGGTSYPGADMLKQHVSYGRMLAEDAGLDELKMRAINEHHGQQQLEDGKRYDGQSPRTMFTAVLMMADTLEAITSGQGRQRANELLMGICEQRIDAGEFDAVGHDEMREATAKLIAGSAEAPSPSM